MKEMVYRMSMNLEKIVKEMENMEKNEYDGAFSIVLQGVLYLYMEDKWDELKLDEDLDKFYKRIGGKVSPSLIEKGKEFVRETKHYKKRLTGKTFDSMIV